jgi:hypothetical protein
MGKKQVGTSTDCPVACIIKYYDNKYFTGHDSIRNNIRNAPEE